MNDVIHVSIKRFNIEFDIKLDWFIYVPFIGWLYPFIVKKDDAFAMHHAKQAFIMAIFFSAVPIALSFLMVLLPHSLRIVKFIVVIMIYLSHSFYFLLCMWGTFLTVKIRRYDFPVIKKFVPLIDV